MGSVKLLEGEMERILSAMAEMTPGSDEYRVALEDLTKIRDLIEKDEKLLTEFEKLGLERKKVKTDKALKIADIAVNGGKIIAVIGTTALCIMADQKGLFVSKLGMNSIPKLKM